MIFLKFIEHLFPNCQNPPEVCQTCDMPIKPLDGPHVRGEVPDDSVVGDCWLLETGGLAKHKLIDKSLGRLGRPNYEIVTRCAET